MIIQKFGLLPLSKKQCNAIDALNNKIKMGEYRLVENICLCKNTDTTFDLVISCEDRYGIPVTSVLCKKCGLVRSKKVLEDRSAHAFYEYEYRAIYERNIFRLEDSSKSTVFEKRKKRGLYFLGLLQRLVVLKNIRTVLEIGCGNGGIIAPFYEYGLDVTGCDFDKDYLEFGKRQGLNLVYGEHKNSGDQYDLIILSHVLEHFNDPVKSFNHFALSIIPEKYFLIEVPGVFLDEPGYNLNPFVSLQNAHVVQFFYQFYLNFLFETLGFHVLYGDERCTFVIQKPKHWKPIYPEKIYAKEMTDWAKKIEKYICMYQDKKIKL